MIGEKKAANAMGGKTARACDSCLRRRARWFCAADDAFLCQACDASVHSANQLASRHERVRLKNSSFKLPTTADDDSPPAWHRGFTRKARTPRNNHKPKEEERGGVFNPLPFVPEIGSEEGGSPDADDDDEEQLLYRVPVFDPFAAELCNEMGNAIVDERTTVADDMDDLHGLLPSDMELAEFAADVESLLGKGVEDYSCDVGERRSVKVEEEEELEDIVACQFNPPVDMMRETLDWNIFDYDESPAAEEKVEQKVAPMAVAENKKTKGEMFLRLNYEAVIAAWASHVSPWTTGARPELNPDGCSSDFLGLFGREVNEAYGGVGRCDDVGREARVSRYREKRRTRLFSKKIRYEVRKLNAEKRPRMKGRFVKRTPVIMGATASSPNYLNK